MLGSKSQDRLDQLKDQLMKKFNIKNLGKVKTIIRREIIQDFQIGTLKIDHKGYI